MLSGAACNLPCFCNRCTFFFHPPHPAAPPFNPPSPTHHVVLTSPFPLAASCSNCSLRIHFNHILSCLPSCPPSPQVALTSNFRKLQTDVVVKSCQR